VHILWTTIENNAEAKKRVLKKKREVIMITNAAQIVLVGLNLLYVVPALILGGAAALTVLRQFRMFNRHA
jgi:hypothetical protein